MVGFFYDSVSVEVAGASWADAEKQDFTFPANTLIINFVSGTGPVQFSLDGQNLHGEIGGVGQPDSISMTFRDFGVSNVWIRGAGDEDVQVWAWI